MEAQEDIVKTVQLNNSEVTLVGTAHVSKLSVEMVEEHIANGDYDCIAVELCAPRLENITNQAWWKNLDIYQVFKKESRVAFDQFGSGRLSKADSRTDWGGGG